MAKPELALEVLGQLIAQLRDDAPAISALTPDQQVATSWIWFDEWEEEQRGHMLDRMLLICTTAPPPQDELADLLGSLQLGEGPKLAFKDASGSQAAAQLTFDQQFNHVVNWYDAWTPEQQWQFFSGLQAIDAGMMTDFYNNLNALQAPYGQMGDETSAGRRNEWFPAYQACECCRGYVYGCRNMQCMRCGACACCRTGLASMQQSTPGNMTMPRAVMEVGSDRDTWLPECRSCTCCKGYIYACAAQMCGELGECACRYGAQKT